MPQSQAKEKKFSPLTFNSTNVQSAASQKHLGLIVEL